MPPADAETFMDVYLGAGLPRGTQATARRAEFHSLFTPATVTTATQREDFDFSVTLGVRGGKWFARRSRIGWAADLSHWDVRSRELDAEIFALSASLMFRWIIAGDAGRGLEPYVGIGASVFDTDISADFRPGLPEAFRVHSQDLGYNAQAGVSWHLRNGFTILVEYRFARVRDLIDARVQRETIVLFPPVTNALEMNVQAQHLLAGLSFRF